LSQTATLAARTTVLGQKREIVDRVEFCHADGKFHLQPSFDGSVGGAEARDLGRFGGATGVNVNEFHPIMWEDLLITPGRVAAPAGGDEFGGLRLGITKRSQAMKFSTSAKATISSNFLRISARDMPRIAPLRNMFSRPVSSG
jgi:hypothetical protein